MAHLLPFYELYYMHTKIYKLVQKNIAEAEEQASVCSKFSATEFGEDLRKPRSTWEGTPIFLL